MNGGYNYLYVNGFGCRIYKGDEVICISKGTHSRTARLTIGKRYKVIKITKNDVSNDWLVVKCDGGDNRCYNAVNFETVEASKSRYDGDFVKDLESL